MKNVGLLVHAETCTNCVGRENDQEFKKKILVRLVNSKGCLTGVVSEFGERIDSQPDEIARLLH